MGYRVAKPFKTVNRKFAAGVPIESTDIDPASAVGFQDLVDIGVIVADEPQAPAKDGAPSSE